MLRSLKAQRHLLNILKRHNIPTAFYEVFTEVDAAKAYVEKMVRQL